MPGTTRTFSYNLIPEPDEVEGLEARARRILGWVCDGDKRIECHDVVGSPLGVVTMSMTIRARDRWWATQLAQDILNYVTWGLKTNATRLDLQSRRQEPHDHRGYAHGRTKRNRTPRQFSSDEEIVSDPDPADVPFGDAEERST